MSEYLVLRLGKNRHDNINWLVWSTTESEVISSGQVTGVDELGQLHERAGDRKIIALVPASEVCIHQVQMPEKTSRQTVAALPFLMEDDLAEDIDKLHFVALTSKPKGGTKLPVLVVAKQRIEQWLEWLHDADLWPDRMLPDALCLPIDGDRASVLQLEQDVLFRLPDMQVLSIEPQWADIALPAIQQEMTDGVTQLTDINIQLPETIRVETQLVEMPMATLAQEALALKFNMLTGKFRPTKRQAGKWLIWQTAAMLAGVAILLNLSHKGLQIWQLSTQNDALKASITQTYQQAFPNEKRIVDVRRQLNNHLKVMKNGGSSDALLSMLDELVPAFRASQGIKPQSLKFDAKRQEIRLQAIAASFQQFEQFKDAILKLDMTVEQGALSQQDDEVVGTLSIRRAS